MSAASSRFVAKARHCRPARSRAWAAAGSGSVVCDVRCEGHSAPTVGPHDRLHRGRGPPEALALQVRPHLQAAVQAFRWAFALGVGFVVAGQDFGDCGVPQCAFRRRCRAIREIGARGDLHAVHGQCPTDRCDPVGVLVLVAERTDQRCRGSHFRAKKLVATLSISMVCSSSLVFTLPLLLADTPATTPLSTSA